MKIMLSFWISHYFAEHGDKAVWEFLQVARKRCAPQEIMTPDSCHRGSWSLRVFTRFQSLFRFVRVRGDRNLWSRPKPAFFEVWLIIVNWWFNHRFESWRDVHSEQRNALQVSFF